jgi:hypothetical protein
MVAVNAGKRIKVFAATAYTLACPPDAAAQKPAEKRLFQ